MRTARKGCAPLCPSAIIVAPLIWVSFEWLRYVVTGQLWNALGYSQAFHPWLIQSARAGGVYAVTFLLLALNVGFAQMLLRRFRFGIATLAATLILAIILSYGFILLGRLRRPRRSTLSFWQSNPTCPWILP